MRTFVKVVAVGAVVGAFGVGMGEAEAKDLTGRFGIGYENTLVGGPGTSLSGVSARYYATPQFFVGGQLGYLMRDPDAEGADSESNFGLGVNGGYVFIDEPNLNLYGGVGLAFGSVAVTGAGPGGAPETEGKSALGLNAGLGMEFFFVGLPNLGFTAAVGLSYASVDDVGSEMAIGGGEFSMFGIRYYFGGPSGPTG